MTQDVVAEGALMNKPFDESYALIDDMAQNYYQWRNKRALVVKALQKGELYEVSALDHMNANVEALY